MSKTLKFLGISCLAWAAVAGSAKATTIGTVEACFTCFANFANPTFDPGVLLTPGVGFSFSNTTGIDITDGVFQIQVGGDNSATDSFQVGTIAADTTVYVTPGVSDDGGSGHTFFAVTGTPLDTGQVGPNSDGVPFEFTGLWNGMNVDTGVFTPAATDGPSNDGFQANVNFLGGPNGDACGDCFGPTVIADINTASSPPPPPVPEPASIVLLGSALLGLALVRRRRAG